jgi:hypothetical protein
MWDALSNERVCRLQLLLTLTSESFSGPSPLGLVTISYSLRFGTSLFVASYDSQDYGGVIRLRLHTGACQFSTDSLNITILHGGIIKQCFQQYPYCCVVFDDPLLRNRFSCCCVHVHFRGTLFTAVA